MDEYFFVRVDPDDYKIDRPYSPPKGWEIVGAVTVPEKRGFFFILHRTL